MSDIDSCCVTGQNCRARAHQRVRTECFACGMPVCTGAACSIRTKYRKYGTKRICATCIESNKDTLGEAWARLKVAVAEDNGVSMEEVERVWG
jgi:hypothetical protein